VDRSISRVVDTWAKTQVEAAAIALDQTVLTNQFGFIPIIRLILLANPQNQVKIIFSHLLQKLFILPRMRNAQLDFAHTSLPKKAPLSCVLPIRSHSIFC
jgi:hypothetical protein